MQKTKVEEPLEIDEFEGIDVEVLIPATTAPQEIIPEQKDCIVSDSNLLDLYDEILDNCRKDRSTADEVLTNFLDMVLNDGDASSASKEAIVNVLKIKSDTADKMAKVADLMTRIKLKDTNTFPRYLSQTQNHLHIDAGNNKRDLIKSMNKLVNKAKTNDKSN